MSDNKGGLNWTRVKEIETKKDNSLMTKVFDDGVNCCDIKQGTLGDCYLLSAMSVIAHTRPELIQKIFHPRSRDYQDSGLYTLMFFRNRKPVIITVDDNFPTDKSVKFFILKCIYRIDTHMSKLALIKQVFMKYGQC